MLENLKVEDKLYMGVGNIIPLKMGNFSPLLTIQTSGILFHKNIVRVVFDQLSDNK